VSGAARKARGGLVYSTEAGRMCPSCRQPVAQCACAKRAPPAAGDGIVRVAREKAGRGGKIVTVVRGLVLEDVPLAELARRLRGACGTGGTVKDGVIELQGDHCDKIVAHLQGLGHTVRRAGG
jgi:translation initiation factor 1